MSVRPSPGGVGGSGSQRPPPPPDPTLVLSGKNSVTSLVFLDGDVILTGHQNGMIQEWSLPIRRAVTTWTGHSDTVLWLTTVTANANEGDGNQLLLPVVLLSQGRDGVVKAWTQHSGNSNQWIFIAQVSSAPLIFCSSAVVDSTLGKCLATPSEETSHINVHDVRIKNISPSSEPTEQESLISISPTPNRVLKPSDVKGYGMCMRMRAVVSCSSRDSISKCDGCLVVGYESGAIALWDALQGEMLHSLRVHDDSVMALTCWSNQSSGETVGLSASVNNVIQCWKITDDKMIIKDNAVSVTNEGFNDVAVRKDGRIFVSGGWDGRGRVFSLKKLRPLAVLTYHKESINCVAFGPNNELVLASKDGYITFWDVFKDS